MNEHERTHLDLFSGIGGFAIAAAWAGFRTVAFCEIDPYCQRVLKERFGAVNAGNEGKRLKCRRIGGGQAQDRKVFDVQSSNGSPSLWGDIRTLDGTRYRGVDLLTAGVPCQPASQAGKRLGRHDDRWLWPSALRILGEAQPTFAVFENPLGLLTLEGGLVFESLLTEMEGHGYEVCPPLIIPACGVKADYYRYRIFVVAYLARPRFGAGHGCRQIPAWGWRRRFTDRFGEVAGDTPSLARRAGLSDSESERQPSGSTPKFTWPETHFELLRGVPGLPNRLDRNRRARIHALGNSVVPAQVFPILKAISEILISTQSP